MYETILQKDQRGQEEDDNYSRNMGLQELNETIYCSIIAILHDSIGE